MPQQPPALDLHSGRQNVGLSTARRLTWLDHVVPFDFAIPFHMMVAMIGGVLAIVHASCHMLDYIHAVCLKAYSANASICELC